MIEIPLQAGFENSHQEFNIKLGGNNFKFELDYSYLYGLWLVNIDVNGFRLVSGTVLAAGSCLNRGADEYGRLYFLGDDATMFSLGNLKQDQLEEIARGVARNEFSLADHLGLLPDGCAACGQWEDCRGGDRLSGVYFDRQPADPYCGLLKQGVPL